MHTLWEKAIRFRHPDYDPDRAQKLISSSMSRHLSTRKLSSKSMHAFLSNLANRQTYRQSNLHPPLSEVNNNNNNNNNNNMSNIMPFWMTRVGGFRSWLAIEVQRAHVFVPASFNRCPALQRGSSARRFCFSRPPALVLTPAFLFTLTFKLLRFGNTVLQRVIGTLAWPCRLCSYQ